MKAIGVILIGLAAFAFLSQKSEEASVDAQLAADRERRKKDGIGPVIQFERQNREGTKRKWIEV